MYEVVSLPAGCKAIGCCWVLDYKTSDSGIYIYKGRLVAKGFHQIPGIDYDKTFAAVCKSTSVRLLTAVSTRLDWDLECFDANRAFLWGDLDEEIYMTIPKGFPRGGNTDTWRLRKSIYGLKQASNVWYQKFRGVLEALGFVRSEVDHAFFVFKGIWQDHSVHCLLAIHVDDGLAGSNNSDFLVWVKAKISAAFGIKDLGVVKRFLGIHIRKSARVQNCLIGADWLQLVAQHGWTQFV